MEKNQDSIRLASEFRRTERTKFRSVSQEGLLSSEERKKNQDSFASSEKQKRTKIRSGRLPIFGKSRTKIRSGGFLNSEVRKRTKIRSGGLPSSGERKKIKIRRFGWISDEWMNQNQDS
ncbi:hypothetical protein RIR_jg13247.t1 [Rhizophagus irregularis DAOM 181602=DAOM 197198]|nr:hypothetical protein RIR_jg13247.t1 [Rhizophagus irregularis DAOM 181602=DAOM 197198]